jgi:hypothetical protein
MDWLHTITPTPAVTLLRRKFLSVLDLHRRSDHESVQRRKFRSALTSPRRGPRPWQTTTHARYDAQLRNAVESETRRQHPAASRCSRGVGWPSRRTSVTQSMPCLRSATRCPANEVSYQDCVFVFRRKVRIGRAHIF